MLVFILRRLLQSLVVMLAVAFIAFTLFQYVGDPVAQMVGQDATQAQRDELRHDLGLDQSFLVQFAHFVGNAARGEFGLSLRQGRKVSSLIVERFPATLELSVTAAVIALVVGIPLGVYAALRRGTLRLAADDDAVAAGRLAADLPDRHPADPVLRRPAELAAELRPRRRGRASAAGRRASSRSTAGATWCCRRSRWRSSSSR